MLPDNLYSVSQVRQMDALAINEYDIPAYTLMQRAGQAAFARLQEILFPVSDLTRVLIVCGAGNNGGDGYVLAMLAKEAGYSVGVIATKDITELKGAAREAADEYILQGGETQGCEDISSVLNYYDMVVDALLGTGLERDVEGKLANIIDTINTVEMPVLALDIPSGIHGDTGSVMGVAIKATHTISFIGLKQGLFLGDAPDYVGQISFASLDVPEQVTSQFSASVKRLSNPLPLLHDCLPARNRTAYKHQFGHVLIIGGDYGMNGAVAMAGSAALRVGAGLVSIATRPEHAAVINSQQPELMCHGISGHDILEELLEKATVVAIGPGLGQTPWAQTLFATVLETDKPLLVDADGLNLLAQQEFQRDQWILTPHTGEAARLLGVTNPHIQRHRLEAARLLAEKYNAAIVLKGVGSLIANNEDVALCDLGNPGMASAGMGDILTGVISGLLAQGLSITEAAQLGVLLHANAGDDAAAESGERGLLATDLLPYLKIAVNA